MLFPTISEECQEDLDDEFPIMEWTSFYNYDSNSVREEELKISSVEELVEHYPNHTKKLTNNNIKQAKKFFNKLA